MLAAQRSVPISDDFKVRRDDDRAKNNRGNYVLGSAATRDNKVAVFSIGIVFKQPRVTLHALEHRVCLMMSE